MNDHIKANPGLSANEATAQWTAAKFGSWIAENIGDDFLIADQGTNGFTVDLTHEDDAHAFMTKLGDHLG